MYSNFCNVILITIIIYKICSTANMQSPKGYVELIADNAKTKENSTNVSVSINSTKDGEVEQNNLLMNFLLKDETLSAFNIPFVNKEYAIDVLKSATSSAEDFRNTSIGDAKIEDKEKTEKIFNTTNVMKSLNSGEERGTTLGLSFGDKTAPIFNLSYINNENSMTSVADNENTTGIEQITNKKDKKGVVMDRDESTTNNLNKTMEITTNRNTNTTTTTERTTTTEIILSELDNLSYNDGEELTVGQKIEFQLSKMNSDVDSSNSAGVEILKNISRICGSLFGKRISFANETTLMEYPWTALLLYNTKIRYHCGGSLITEKYVLTAAHCVAQEFYELNGVRLGEHDIAKSIDCAPDLVGDKICATTIDVNVVKIIVHHAYSHLSFKNDIALLRLDKDYINRSYYPICIPTAEMMPDDKKATVAGWGATEKALRSSILLKADVPIFNMSRCREIYRYGVFNDATEICGSGKDEVDVCKGDSGGALFYNKYINGKDKYYQLGIISLGVRRCGDSRFLPAVFTKINGFYKWIENNLEY